MGKEAASICWQRMSGSLGSNGEGRNKKSQAKRRIV
jgi:hypothetical protein